MTVEELIALIRRYHKTEGVVFDGTRWIHPMGYLEERAEILAVLHYEGLDLIDSGENGMLISLLGE